MCYYFANFSIEIVFKRKNVFGKMNYPTLVGAFGVSFELNIIYISRWF